MELVDDFGNPLTIGPYTALARLGVGGMGEVLLVSRLDPHGVPQVAVLKRILPAYSQDPEFRRMFLNEAKLVGMLSHPNIARVLDFGMTRGDYYLVVEYVEGPSLSRLLRLAGSDGGLPLDVALSVAVGIGRALQHTHEATGDEGKPLGLVHRDISPSNVMIARSGAAKLIDFGIATATAATRVTRTGTLKGKASYMSPEMSKSGRVDHRSDIYGLGVLLYEMTTGRRLFRGESELAVLNAVARGVFAAPTELISDYPKTLESIVLRALANDPCHRYETVASMLEAVQSFAHDASIELEESPVAAFVLDTLGPTERMPGASLQPALVPFEGPLAPAPRRARPWSYAALAIVTGTVGFVASGLVRQPEPDPEPSVVAPQNPEHPEARIDLPAPVDHAVRLDVPPLEPVAAEVEVEPVVEKARPRRRRRRVPRRRRTEASASSNDDGRVTVDQLRPPKSSK